MHAYNDKHSLLTTLSLSHFVTRKKTCDKSLLYKTTVVDITNFSSFRELNRSDSRTLFTFIQTSSIKNHNPCVSISVLSSGDLIQLEFE